jgi:serine/threonine-protein kinase
MELLTGESLADLLDRKGSLPATRVVQMILPVLSGLGVAHDSGIVHRDLKPENILLVASQTGEVVPKLVDFGIAKHTRSKVETPDVDAIDDQVAHHRELARKLTRAGALMGSPDYMSPEQARGDVGIDERSDLWSLSVVLYESLCGCRPFDHRDLQKLLMAILLDDPLPITAHGAGDNELWQIVRRGLAKKREDRWRSAEEMGRALAEWLLDQDIEADISGVTLRHRWLGEGHERRYELTPTDIAAEQSVPSIPVPILRPSSNRKSVLIGLGALGLTLGISLAMLQQRSEAPSSEPTSLVEDAPAAAPAAPAAAMPSARARPSASAPRSAPPPPTASSPAPVRATPAPLPPSAPARKPASGHTMPIPDTPDF